MGERRLRIRQSEPGPPRRWVVRLERGEEVMEAMAEVARRESIGGAEVSGIGAFERCVIGFYNRTAREYDRVPVDEDVEVLGLMGNLSLTDEGPRVHLHATLGRPNGAAMGGHLLEGRVGATAEVFIREEAVELRRAPDAEIGLPLLDL